MPGVRKVEVCRLKKTICTYFLLLAIITMQGCTKATQKHEDLFNSKINATSAVEVPIDKLTDFEWSVVCVLPQYVSFSDLTKKYPFLKKAEGADFKLSHDDELYLEQKRPLFYSIVICYFVNRCIFQAYLVPPIYPVHMMC